MSRQQKNAFTMHSNAQQMLSKLAVTMPLGSGAFPFLRRAGRILPSHSTLNNYSIHLFINLTHSL